MTGALMGLQIVLTGFRAGSVRGKVFGKEFMESKEAKLLADEHKKATGSDKLPKEGYPDMGNGRFADALSYKDWFAFNNAQRAHYNYLEHAATAISCHLMAGLVYPQFATATAVAYILGREIYTHGYLQDPSKRAPGAVIVDLALVAMFGGAMTSGARIAGLIKL